jgi:hypothetical protein
MSRFQINQIAFFQTRHLRVSKDLQRRASSSEHTRSKLERLVIYLFVVEQNTTFSLSLSLDCNKLANRPLFIDIIDGMLCDVSAMQVAADCDAHCH